MTDTTSPSARVNLPGFGLSRLHGWERNDAKFPHALDTDGRGKLSLGVFVRERRMLSFMDTITDKPDWQRKIFDSGIYGEWRQEATDIDFIDDAGDEEFLSAPMFNNEKAKRFEQTGFVLILDAELAVVKSDVAVSRDLEAALRKSVAVLEDVPDRDKDWHPGTDQQVLDLLHPSLFPVVFGRTRALRTGRVPLDACVEYTGLGELTHDTPQKDGEAYQQDLYQWLPSDVALTDAGATITSYINNLHPKEHKALYGVLAKFVDAAVPLWEECLSRHEDRRRFKVEFTDDEEDYYLPEGVTYDIPADADGDDYKWSDEYITWKERHRILKMREPNPFVPFEEQVDHAKRVNLRAQFPEGLQVIFKLANIHLTPDKPMYDGGSWHIEGTLAERICATAIYYYDEENITASHLRFRQGIDEDELMMIPAQHAFSSLEKYFGVEHGRPAVQELGSVVTRAGRLLVFPNVLQHCVGSFGLEDKTKPGHRKILAMFLVDPRRRVLSTANVPPQRRDWWANLVREIPVFSRLPPEIFDSIIEKVDTFPFSWREAMSIRADLMEKRSALTETQDENMNDVQFSFCEH